MPPPASPIACWKKPPTFPPANRTPACPPSKRWQATCSSRADNLEALKALLPFYAGQVKCIYIDPPYNTRSAFEHYDDKLEHTKWLAIV